MSLFQSIVTSLFYVFSLVSYVSSHTLPTPTEVTVTEVVKDNDIMISVLPQRVNKDYKDGGQENTRVKRSLEQLAEAARLPLDKLTGFVLLGFTNFISNQPHIGAFENRFINGGKPPIKATLAAKNFADVIKGAIDIITRRKLYFETHTL